MIFILPFTFMPRPNSISRHTFLYPGNSFLPAGTMGHPYCSGPASPPRVFACNGFSDFPASSHSPGPFSSVFSFGDACLMSSSRAKLLSVSLLWAPAIWCVPSSDPTTPNWWLAPLPTPSRFAKCFNVFVSDLLAPHRKLGEK